MMWICSTQCFFGLLSPKQLPPTRNNASSWRRHMHACNQQISSLPHIQMPLVVRIANLTCASSSLGQEEDTDMQ